MSSLLLDAGAVALGAGIPLAISRSRSRNLLTDPRARDVAFYTMLVSGLAFAATRSGVLGALALGSGGAWVVMKADDITSHFP